MAPSLAKSGEGFLFPEFCYNQAMKQTAGEFLDLLNTKHAKLHHAYETLFWISYMGDHSVNDKMKKALEARDQFRANRKLYDEVKMFLKTASQKDKVRLNYWKLFFEKYQMPESVLGIKKKIDELESKIHKGIATRKEGYVDPKTKKFVTASKNKMGAMLRTEADEVLRKAAFTALEKLAEGFVDEYVTLVGLKNEFAQTLGFSDFYAYKLETEEGMKKADLFKIFDEIYEKTKYGFDTIKNLEKTMPGLRKPWNFGYMLAGDFTKEEDPYFPFDEALSRWGRSFAALGIDYQGGQLQLDLLDRAGKYNNGFCHWPDLVYYANKKWHKGSSNFTCNVVYGQVGSGSEGMHTLFHEGGHAADRINSKQSESCINTEYPPASTAWAETHSMFLDTMYNSIEWRMRYAKNKEGVSYPFDLFKRRVEKVGIIAPLTMMNVHDVMEFERRVYEAKNLTREKVLSIARQCFKKFFDRSEDSISLLGVPHIYSWESSCSYHGYGLAQLALMQWRAYFYDKYGYVVDNKNVGKEMTKVWNLGSSKTFPEYVKIATGKKLSPKAFIKVVTMTTPQKIALAKKRLARMEKVKPYSKPVDLNANIRMVHGKEVVADNKKSFEAMAEKYAKWLNKDKK